MGGKTRRGKKSGAGRRSVKANGMAPPVRAPTPAAADDASNSLSNSSAHLLNDAASFSNLSQMSNDQGVIESVVNEKERMANQASMEGRALQLYETMETKLVEVEQRLAESQKRLAESEGREEQAAKEAKKLAMELATERDARKRDVQALDDARRETVTAQEQGERKAKEWEGKLTGAETRIEELVRICYTIQEKLRETQHREWLTKMQVDDEKKRMGMPTAGVLLKEVEEKAERLAGDLAKARGKAAVWEKDNEALRAGKRQMEASHLSMAARAEQAEQRLEASEKEVRMLQGNVEELGRRNKELEGANEGFEVRKRRVEKKREGEEEEEEEVERVLEGEKAGTVKELAAVHAREEKLEEEMESLSAEEEENATLARNQDLRQLAPPMGALPSPGRRLEEVAKEGNEQRGENLGALQAKYRVGDLAAALMAVVGDEAKILKLPLLSQQLIGRWSKWALCVVQGLLLPLGL